MQVEHADVQRVHELIIEADALIRWPSDRRTMPMADLEANIHLARIRGLFGAIRVLLDVDRALEAHILSRPLFEDALRLEFFAGLSPEGREAVFLHRQFSMWTDMQAKYGDLRSSLGQRSLTDEERATIRARLADIERRRARLGVKPRPYPSPKDLALRFGYRDDFWLYSITHDAVHGTSLGRMTQVRFREGGEADIEERANAPWFVAGLGILAMRSALRGAGAAARVIGWDPAAIDACLATVQAFDEELDSREGDEPAT